MSLDSQREELQRLAAGKGIAIVQEYSDVVESGSDINRPGYQSLVAAIANPKRGWDTLLLLDTSRLARRQHIATVFSHEAQKRGVRILYARIPELDPVNEVLVMSVMRAMDEIHSLTSRDKGLAGMRQNVQRGYRAGGRAPLGYRLRSVAIGIVREGKPVTKSVLEPSDDADAVARYLRARACGAPRSQALAESGLELTKTSANGIEWNALTYAGCTVWNVHGERRGGATVAGTRRRPRPEWIIKDGTHPALIEREIAEALLQQLETTSRAASLSAARRSTSPHLLSTLLQDPAGIRYRGNTRRSGERIERHYRYDAPDGRSRYFPAEAVERAVLQQIEADLRAPELADLLLAAAQDEALRSQYEAEGKRLTLQAQRARKDADKAMKLSLALEDPAPALRRVEESEREHKRFLADLQQLEEDWQQRQRSASLSREALTDMLEALADDFEAATDVDELRPIIEMFLDRIELDPITGACTLHYRLAHHETCSPYVASPRVRAFSPTFQRHIRVA